MRSNDKDLALVLNSIRNRRSNVFMKSLFRTINKSYRESIDRVQDRLNDALQSADSSETDRPPNSTITLTQLKDSLPPGETVITELDMVENVFDVIKSETIRSIRETVNGPIPEFQYFLSIVMAYAQSLLGYLIYPHRRLQMFMFDLCIDSHNTSTLQQLLNFHVILDSQDLLERLVKLHSSQTNRPVWSSQTLLDVAKRMFRTDIVVDTLLQIDRPMDIVEYIRKRDPSYEMEKVFVLLKRYPLVNRRVVWSQVELWNSAGSSSKPVLSHQVIMLNSSIDDSS